MIKMNRQAVLERGKLMIAFVLVGLMVALAAPAIGGDIPNLAPARLSDSGQILSNGPEVNVARTGQEPAPLKKKTPIKVGFTPTAMNTHYDIVIAGAKAAVDELGGKDVIDLVIQAPSSQSGTAEQMNIVETWVQQGYDAIGICTANDQAMTPIYKKAAEKGIPVFVFNTPVPMSVNPYYVSNVGYDQHEAGRLIGLWLIKNFGDKPTNLVIIEGLPGVHNTERMSGFKEGIAGNNNIKIIASQPGDWVRDRAQSVMENILAVHAKDIDVVWGMYDEMALGALAAIKSRGLSGKITIMGYDNTPDAYEAIKRGEMHSTVDTAPKEMGYNLIMAVKKYVIDGEMVPKVINSEIAVWDQSNIDKFDTNNYKYIQK
jgi:ribose transport system substrate-binding protein